MTRLDYQNICSAVSDGEQKMLLNSRSHLVGRIISCHSEFFNVEVDDGWQVWSMDECEEPAAPMFSASGTDYQI